MKKFAALLLTLCMVLSLVACGGGEKKEEAPKAEDPKTEEPATEEITYDGVFKLGAVGPLTGASAETGVAGKQGQELAVAEWNAKGGLEIDGKHYKIELIYEDSAGAPETAVAAAEKLLGIDKVDAIFAETFLSSCIIACMELAPKYPDVLFSTIEGVSTVIPEKILAEPEKYANFFKPCWNSDTYGGLVADSVFALAAEGAIPAENKTVAFVVEDTDNGRSNADAAAALMEAEGWTVVAYEANPQGATDFYSQINKLMQLDPDVVVTNFVPQASGVAWVKQVAELGAEWSDVAIVYPTKPNFYEDSGNACADLFWVPVEYDPTSEAVKEFEGKMQDMFGVSLTKCQTSGYATTNLMFEAIEKAGTWKATEGLIEAYEEIVYEDPILGTFKFEENHTVKGGTGGLNMATAQIQPDAQTYKIVYPDYSKQADAYPQY